MAAAVPVPSASVADFPDRLDPLLVKELRQGLRNRVFVSCFILVHAGVALSVGLDALLRGAGWGLDFGLMLQLGVELLFVCFLFPARALSALPDEVQASSADFLRLANYDASALVYGKWKTQILLAAILIVSIAPYHFLRYYVGGANIVSHALALVWAWSEAALLSAIALCLSTLRVWARFLWLAVLFFPLWFTLIPPGLLLFAPADAGTIITAIVVWGVVWFGATMFFLTLAVSGFDTRMRYRHLFD